MAIVKELYKTRNDGVKLYRTYSDAGKYVVQNETGVAYTEAIDVETTPYTYSESEVMIEGFEETLREEKAAAYDVLMGVIE